MDLQANPASQPAPGQAEELPGEPTDSLELTHCYCLKSLSLGVPCHTAADKRSGEFPPELISDLNSGLQQNWDGSLLCPDA